MNEIDTMPSADVETDEQARQRRLAAAVNSPGFRSAALGAASGGSPTPAREALNPDSQELYRRALTSAKAGTAAPASVAGAANSSEGTSRNTMPPVNLSPNDEDDRQRRLARISGMMPPVSPQPSSQPVGPAALPPITASPVQSRSDANAVPSAQPPAPLPPVSPPSGDSSQPPAIHPSANAMPPITMPQPRELQPSGRDFSGANAAPVQPGATSAMPPITLGPGERREAELREQGRPGSEEGPQLSKWKKVLDTIGSFFPIGRAIETAIPGSPQNFDWELARATAAGKTERGEKAERQTAENTAATAQFNTPEKREAYMRQHPEQFEDMTKFEKNDWRVSGKFPQREPAPKTERPENLDREAYDYYVGQGMTPADARKRVLQDAQSVKPERQTHTSAFEAFAYGTPEEKKAAQDYLDFEKKAGARYKTPSEFDERYRLFQEDPETYKAMFGDKSGAGPDRATATKMLNYFDKRRREVQNDFMLDDQQKAQQLQDIEGLEKPFMDAVQPGAAVGPANAGGGPTHPGDKHRVSVIAPDGTPGSVPLRQLGAAKKKGYKVAP